MVLSKAIASIQLAQVRHVSRDLRMFTPETWKRNTAVIPLVALIGGVLVGVVGITYHSLANKPDISISRKNPLEESMDMMHPRQTKLAVINQKYEAMPELDAALKAAHKEEPANE